MNLCTAVDIRISLAVQISQFDLILEKDSNWGDCGINQKRAFPK
ncbi:hypothetical protein [Clostridium sporogenes]|nr:hypothetical protein [Clostridium sporogenes]